MINIKKKYFIVCIVALLLGEIVYDACTIDKFVYLTPAELAWTGCYSTNSIILFKDNDNDIDSLYIENVYLKNNHSKFINPFLKLETGGVYSGVTIIRGFIKHKNENINLFICENVNTLYSYTELQITIGNIHSDNKDIRTLISESTRCYNSKSTHIEKDNIQCQIIDDINKISHFEWCQSIGLSSYTFEDGTTYCLFEQN